MALFSSFPALLSLLILVIQAPALALPEYASRPTFAPLALALPAGMALLTSFVADRWRYSSQACGFLAVALIVCGGLLSAAPLTTPSLWLGRALLGGGWGLLLHLGSYRLALFPGAPMKGSLVLILAIPFILASGQLTFNGGAWQSTWLYGAALLVLPALPRLIQSSLIPPEPTSLPTSPWTGYGLMVMSMMVGLVPTHLGLYLHEENLGDARTVGLLLAMMVGGCWTGQWLGCWLKKALGRWFAAPVLLMMALGFALFALTDSGTPLLTACSSIGFSAGALMRLQQQRLPLPLFSRWILAGQLLAPVIFGGLLWAVPSLTVRDLFGLVAMMSCVAVMVRQGPAGHYYNDELDIDDFRPEDHSRKGPKD